MISVYVGLVSLQITGGDLLRAARDHHYSIRTEEDMNAARSRSRSCHARARRARAAHIHITRSRSLSLSVHRPRGGNSLSTISVSDSDDQTRSKPLWLPSPPLPPHPPRRILRPRLARRSSSGWSPRRGRARPSLSRRASSRPPSTALAAKSPSRDWAATGRDSRGASGAGARPIYR